MNCWKPVSESIVIARFNTAYNKLCINVICYYAPTEAAKEEDEDGFYQQLDSIVDEIPDHDMILIMGDMNANPGNRHDAPGYKEEYLKRRKEKK
ncbi:unnamed protein product [Caretta caretta]